MVQVMSVGHAHARDSSLHVVPLRMTEGAEAGWVVQVALVVTRTREILRFA